MEIRIQPWRKKRGLTQQALADKIGADKSTVWRYEKGAVSPFNATMHDIAAALDVPIGDLVSAGSGARVLGNVGAGAVVYPLDDDNEIISAPPDLEDPIAVRVTGTSMMPAYRPGDVLFCEPQSVTRSHIYNEDCVVETEDGQRLVKKVMQGGAPGTVRLYSYETMEAGEDVRLRSAAVVRWIQRR